MTIAEEPEDLTPMERESASDQDRCPYENGGGDECYWCVYYHDPCFPEFNEDDEE